MFSPLAYPAGAIHYNLITHMPSPSHTSLAPFDLYREPMAVIALADGTELAEETFSKRQSVNGTAPTVVEKNIRALDQELENLRDYYPKALVHEALIFDYIPPPSSDIHMPDGITTIPIEEECKRTTIKTVMCDISSLLLAEMTELGKFFEATTTIESPTHYIQQPANGYGSSYDGKPNGVPRRNSQYSMTVSQHHGRSSSTPGGLDRSQARMSMPVPARPGMHSSSSTPGRTPSVPTKSGLSNPPMSPDDVQEPTSGTSTPDSKSAQQDVAEGPRDVAPNRVSVQGFGAGSPSDRWRVRGKGRSAIVVGSMYLQAGRWADSLNHLTEGGTMARTTNDHIWHGKALELILVNLFLLAWSKVDFQIPQICIPTQDGTNKAFLAKLDAPPENDQPKHMRNLQLILPELLDRIINLYSRKRSESEKLPTLPFAEATIRFCKIMSALQLCGGELTHGCLEMIIIGRLPEKYLTTSPRIGIVPTRQHIANLLFDAFPSSGSSELLSSADRASILTGIAAVLGPLGYQRKKAMVIRELVSVLVTGLVEARTRGAADAGVHPAAGLVSLAGHSQSGGAVALDLGEGDIEQGIDAFLNVLCKSYGVVGYDTLKKPSSSEKEEPRQSDEKILARIYKQSSTRFFGFPGIKLDILRACINFSEALPDFSGVLKFSSDLLRTAGSGFAPGARKGDPSAMIYAEEQSRLVANICRTSSLAHRLGFPGLGAEYWDEFLVRGMKLEPLPSTRLPIPHAQHVLPGANAGRASQDVNPFIYNPFLKKPDNSAVEHFIVAEELATFRITLQNPYDIEVDIESIKLDTEGVEFEALPEQTRLGANRTQVMRLRGRPKEKGSVKVTGAIIKARGCRERRFPIFVQPWAPDRDYKLKAKGITALEGGNELMKRASVPLEPQALSLSVVPAQPVLVVKSTTLPQSTVMILEGERRIFSVTLQNKSSTPVDFMLFSFKDSTQAPLQAGLSNRDATPAELYEYELILLKKQALRLPNGAQTRYIAPEGEATFDFEMLGKPGLINATIQVDYTHLGIPREEVKEQFFTRQVSLDVMVTVNASVELSRIDALPAHTEIPDALWSHFGSTPANPSDYCLILADLRNSWPTAMSVRIESDQDIVGESTILPGNTSRSIIPVKKVFLEDAHASIPSLHPERDRQFVVSTSKTTPEVERQNREAFWYREKMLERVKATWTTTTEPKRSGTVELRSLRLTPRMVDAIKIDEVGIDISIEPSVEGGEGAGNTAYVDELTQVKVKVTNRTSKPILALVRLLPSLCHRPLNVALEYTRKLAWNGTMQQLLPVMPAKGSAEFVIGVTALCRGEFELTATVEEVQVWEDKAKRGSLTRPRSDTQAMLDAAVGAKERRMWHSSQPYILRAADRD